MIRAIISRRPFLRDLAAVAIYVIFNVFVFHFSEPYFSSLVKNKTGENFTTLLRRYRIDRAQELLINTSLSINEIALYVGYSDGPYFMRQFKKETGETPTEFRVRNRRQ